MKRWIWLLLLAALAAPSVAEAQIPLRCKVTLTPPVYIDGSVDFLSCDPSGSLRTLTLGGTGGGTFSTFGLVWPAFGTAAGYLDGAALMQGARVHDLDTGLGTEYNLGLSLRLSGPGGSVEAGTVANPLNVAIVGGGGGGGTQYNQGTPTTASDTLTMAGAVRHDTATVDAGVADGDRVVLSTDALGRIWVNGSGVTQPISVASLPLPAGAATAARQDTGNTALSSIDGKIPAAPSTAGKQDTGNTSLASIDGKIPASPATTGKQDTGNVSLASIDGKVPADPAREGGNLATLAGKDFATAAKQDTAQTTLGQIKTDVDKIPADPAREGGNLATLVTNTTAIATAARQDTGNVSLASIKTNTDPLVTAGAGGYVRQDSNATIAKETGGNLDTIALKTTEIDAKLTAPLNVRITPMSTIASTTVAATQLNTTLLASNFGRRSWSVCNQAPDPMYVKFGATASGTSYHVMIPPRQCYSEPTTQPTYTGQIDAIWWPGTQGQALVTELQ